MFNFLMKISVFESMHDLIRYKFSVSLITIKLNNGILFSVLFYCEFVQIFSSNIKYCLHDFKVFVRTPTAFNYNQP